MAFVVALKDGDDLFKADLLRAHSKDRAGTSGRREQLSCAVRMRAVWQNTGDKRAEKDGTDAGVPCKPG